MTTKKKVESHSSTDSSTGSSTDNSSSSSSSSGSGSDSSSSSDSDSSSSQEGNKNPQVVESKKPEAVRKPRKSVDGKQQQTNTLKSKPKVKQQPQPQQQQKRSIYSTDDDEESKHDKLKQRKNPTKPKTVATAAPKQSPIKSKPVSKPPVKTTTIKDVIKSKAAAKTLIRNESSSNNKKKSIFSPENSSESDNPTNLKLTAIKGQVKNNQKPRTKASPRALNKTEPKRIEKPIIKPKPKPEIKPKVSASSNSSSSDSSSDSDSDSSNSSDNKKKGKGKVCKKESNSETEGESNEKVTKKLTRSSNARKSKHILGKNLFSDTDSDDSDSTKRALSRSPVKKTPVSSTPTTTTKGKQKSKKSEVKQRSNEVLEERKCPVEGCDSNGHVSGRHDKHFTVDACLLYHNLTVALSKDQMIERKKRDELRKKGIEAYKKTVKTHPTNEQKLYLQKVKDLRMKFKQEGNDDHKPIIDKNKEPNLNNFVSDYDLKLFRDAQAISSEKIEEDLKTLPNTKGTKYIEMGKFEMEVWYQSPYPEDYARLPKLYICEFCLRYMKSRTVLHRHVVKCVWRHPPGEEVYRKDKISVWEVDGKRYKQYCQNLCLLAKFFLDHKTLYYDVEPFLFYVMTMADGEGCHTVGYFSKEKNSFLNYNVSCILTLPPYQRQGYGRLLIDFSYLLTRVEGKIGSPEKPLSDLGLISYRSYWKDVLLGYLCSRAGTTLSVKDISQEMAIHSYDIVSTMQALGMMKYWKGKHIILKKQDVLDEYVERVKRRGSLLKEVDPSCLKWKPFVPPQPNPV